MPEKRIVPVISSLKEFEEKLPGFLDANKSMSILLDYDGTLAPIVDNPNNTAMPVELEKTLHKLVNHPNIFTAVISGRGLKDVQARVGIGGIAYGGNHGLEIEIDGQRHDYELPAKIKESYTKLVQELNEKVAKGDSWVEDKKVSLTFHYRGADISDEDRKLAKQIIESHGFKANQAHEAIEAKPPVNWNKGEAAAFILKHKFGTDWAHQTRVIFAGDDTTDEDAMRKLQGVGKSFRVSSDPQIQTYADFRLPQQDVMIDLMKWVASVYKN